MIHGVAAPEDPDILAPTEEGWKETTPCVSLGMIHHKCRTATQSQKLKRVARFWESAMH